MNGWSHFWFRPASRRGRDVARVLVALNALWILASRTDLPSLASWPASFLIHSRLTRLRYGMILPERMEFALFILTCLALIAVTLQWATRLAAGAAGLLLYHFAPFENVLSSRVGPYFNGLTLPVLALLIIAFAAPPSEESSEENRWPFALIQVIFSFNYLLAGVSKLRHSGYEWVSGDNVRSTIEVFNAFEPPVRPLAQLLVSNPGLCSAVALMTILLEIGILVALIAPRTSLIVVILLFLGHIGIALTLGVVFLNLPLVLLFLDWDR